MKILLILMTIQVIEAKFEEADDEQSIWDRLMKFSSQFLFKKLTLFKINFKSITYPNIRLWMMITWQCDNNIESDNDRTDEVRVWRIKWWIVRDHQAKFNNQCLFEELVLLKFEDQMTNNQLNINKRSLVFNFYSNMRFIQDQLKINNWPKYLALIKAFMINWLHDDMVSW